MDQIFPLVLIGGMVVFMVMSGRKRKAQAAELAAKLLPGSKVMLSSGIYGEVVAIADDRVTIKSAGSTVLEVAKGAVTRVVENPIEKKTSSKVVGEKTTTKKPVAKK